VKKELQQIDSHNAPKLQTKDNWEVSWNNFVVTSIYLLQKLKYKHLIPFCISKKTA
jgi:hypothetical protein